jgi:S1-C subfamily serine protease
VVVGNTEIGIGGDLIMEIDGQKVDRGDSLTRALANKRPGDSMELLIYRAGKKSKMKVTLGDSPDEPV